MRKGNDKAPVRRPYRKPVVEKVLLNAEEAVLSGCKALNAVGKNSLNCKLGTSSCKFSHAS
jgi:hypothetical protein